MNKKCIFLFAALLLFNCNSSQSDCEVNKCGSSRTLCHLVLLSMLTNREGLGKGVGFFLLDEVCSAVEDDCKKECRKSYPLPIF